MKCDVCGAGYNDECDVDAHERGAVAFYQGLVDMAIAIQKRWCCDVHQWDRDAGRKAGVCGWF